MRRYLLITSTCVCLCGTAFLAFAKLASSTPSGPRVVTLRAQDIAVWGGVQCIANEEAGSKHFLCSRRPRSKAKYDTAIFPSSVIVYKMGSPDNPLFATH